LASRIVIWPVASSVVIPLIELALPLSKSEAPDVVGEERLAAPADLHRPLERDAPMSRQAAAGSF
jgi:hypothetical protein